jgi:carbon storage regulator CsrA
MLILTRKIDQAIVIQGNITIMVLGVERDRVKLGIQAPAEVAVLREELVADEAMPAPSPLRRRTVKTNVTPIHGALALQPETKD